MIKTITNKLKLAIKISFLGAGLFFKLKLLAVFFYFFLKKKSGIKNKSDFKIKIKKFGKIFNIWLQDLTDFFILKEIFLEDEYDLNLKKEPEIIFDIGSNIGLSVIYFKLKYPDVKIYAFEPDPENYKRLKKNISEFPDIFAFNCAISDRNGKVKFYRYPDRIASSSLIRRFPDQHYIKVESRTLDDLIKEFSLDAVDLLKFDIEGGEKKLFKDFAGFGKLKNIIGEIHFDLIDMSRENFLNIFKDYCLETKEFAPNRIIIKAISF